MKCIIYAIKLYDSFENQPVLLEYSKLKVIDDSKGKVNNVLTLSKGYLLHLIEGEDSDVEFLCQNIVKDNKFGEAIDLLETPVKKRSFTDKHLAVVPSLIRYQEFSLFMYRNKNTFCGLSAERESILQKFGLFKNGIDKQSTQRKSNLNVPENKYVGTFLSLSGWVDLNSKSTSEQDEMLGLSLRAKLLYGSHLFEDLVAAGHFGNEQQIIKVLDECSVLDSLIVKKAVKECNCNAVDSLIINQAEQESNVSSDNLAKKPRFGISLYKKLSEWLN
jgi:hypothetical protein